MPSSQASGRAKRRQRLTVRTGTNGDDVIVGLEGNDQIEGGAGHDILCGSQGDDTLIGGTGDDVLRGGYGSDWASYRWAPGAVIVDLVAKTVTGHGTDSISGIENIVGSPFSDKIYANNVNNILRGSGGVDFIRGRDGDDTIHGGPAYDLIYGGEGDDVLFTDCGGDFEGPGQFDYISGGHGNDSWWQPPHARCCPADRATTPWKAATAAMTSTPVTATTSLTVQERSIPCCTATPPARCSLTW